MHFVYLVTVVPGEAGRAPKLPYLGRGTEEQRARRRSADDRGGSPPPIDDFETRFVLGAGYRSLTGPTGRSWTC